MCKMHISLNSVSELCVKNMEKILKMTIKVSYSNVNDINDVCPDDVWAHSIQIQYLVRLIKQERVGSLNIMFASAALWEETMSKSKRDRNIFLIFIMAEKGLELKQKLVEELPKSVASTAICLVNMRNMSNNSQESWLGGFQTHVYHLELKKRPDEKAVLSLQHSF